MADIRAMASMPGASRDPTFHDISPELNKVSMKEKLAAAHRNIAFLQAEHTLMIKGLHEEIERLQRYIKDMQFRKEILEIVAPDNEFFNCDLATLEQKIDKLISDNREMKRRLQESNRALEILDQKQNLHKWQYQQELEERDQTILRLQKELELKCSSVAELTYSLSKKKSFFRRFSFNSFDSSAPVSRRDSPTFRPVDDISKAEELKAKSLPSSDFPIQRLHCDYSSYSSLSDKSTSDDEVLRSPFLRKQYTFPSTKYTRCPNDLNPDKTLRLPPIPGLSSPSRQLVRQQIRVDRFATKVVPDLVVDQAAYSVK